MSAATNLYDAQRYRIFRQAVTNSIAKGYSVSTSLHPTGSMIVKLAHPMREPSALIFLPGGKTLSIRQPESE